MEETGVGMDTYRSMREEHNLPLPMITIKKGSVIVTFSRVSGASKVPYVYSGTENLTREEILGYEFIKQKVKVTRKEYASKFGFETKKAERLLRKMVEEKLIQRKGSGPSTFYEVAT